MIAIILNDNNEEVAAAFIPQWEKNVVRSEHDFSFPIKFFLNVNLHGILSEKTKFHFCLW